MNSTELRVDPKGVGMKYEDVEYLFNYVGSVRRFERSAYLNRRTGEWVVASDPGDSDELPDDFEESDDYLKIPHWNDLDLGKSLVFEFIEQRLPSARDLVHDFFRRSGAYGRFRTLLAKKDLLNDWNEYQTQRSRVAMLEWCAKNGIELKE